MDLKKHEEMESKGTTQDLAVDPDSSSTDNLAEAAQMKKRTVSGADYKKEKYIALFQARTILSKHGTVAERRMCSKLLKVMKRDGIKSV